MIVVLSVIKFLNFIFFLRFITVKGCPRVWLVSMFYDRTFIEGKANRINIPFTYKYTFERSCCYPASVICTRIIHMLFNSTVKYYVVIDVMGKKKEKKNHRVWKYPLIWTHYTMEPYNNRLSTRKAIKWLSFYYIFRNFFPFFIFNHIERMRPRKGKWEKK